jgi:dihydroorotate dehydrogenase
MSFYSTFRPALFLLPPEKAHRAAICALQRGLVPAYAPTHDSLKTTLAGLHFANPIGLAPGFDKNAECFEGALRAGCGFVEIGTVTPRPQAGNPQPRVFRLVEHQAIINRLGFNNEGMDAVAKRLARYRDRECVAFHGEPERSERGDSKRSEERRSQPVAGAKRPLSASAPHKIVGGNIGKNKDSESAIADYTAAMRALYPHVDYITANISSPNTPGLRALQAADELKALIEALQSLRTELVAAGASHRPLFVKIAPDGEDSLFEAIAEAARATKLDGLIVSNTTLSREAVAGSAHAKEAGGLSGKPLFAPSTARLKQVYRLTGGSMPLIGVGGVASAADAYAKIRAGASLVQLYSALIYQGFGLVPRINDGLAELLARDGFAKVADAVGVDAR